MKNESRPLHRKRDEIVAEYDKQEKLTNKLGNPYICGLSGQIHGMNTVLNSKELSELVESAQDVIYGITTFSRGPEFVAKLERLQSAIYNFNERPTQDDIDNGGVF